jgi:hypothetical protein
MHAKLSSYATINVIKLIKYETVAAKPFWQVPLLLCTSKSNNRQDSHQLLMKCPYQSAMTFQHLTHEQFVSDTLLIHSKDKQI